MAAINTLRRRVTSIRSDSPTHLFGIGQSVRLKDEAGEYPHPRDVYHITSTLPARDNSPQYRIRSEHDQHERVAMQDTLEPVLKPFGAENAVPIKRAYAAPRAKIVD